MKKRFALITAAGFSAFSIIYLALWLSTEENCNECLNLLQKLDEKINPINDSKALSATLFILAGTAGVATIAGMIELVKYVNTRKRKRLDYTIHDLEAGTTDDLGKALLNYYYALATAIEATGQTTPTTPTTITQPEINLNALRTTLLPQAQQHKEAVIKHYDNPPEQLTDAIQNKYTMIRKNLDFCLELLEEEKYDPALAMLFNAHSHSPHSNEYMDTSVGVYNADISEGVTSYRILPHT